VLLLLLKGEQLLLELLLLLQGQQLRTQRESQAVFRGSQSAFGIGLSRVWSCSSSSSSGGGGGGIGSGVVTVIRKARATQ
jgi:uncharacterized membrane protein